MSFTTVASGDHFAVLIFLVLSQDHLLELPHRLIDLPACPKDLESHNKTVNVPACRTLCNLKHSGRALNGIKHSACALTINYLIQLARYNKFKTYSEPHFQSL